MKKMILKTVMLALILIVFADLKAQNNFPASWLGTYKGTMYIYNTQNGLKDSLDVLFEFLADSTNRWIYRMTYKSMRFGTVIKDYYLLKNDTLAKNSYLLDEKDGIYILQSYMDNCLYSSFTVAGNYLNSIIRKNDDIIDFEIFSSLTKESLKSQNKAKKGQTVFTIQSFPPFTTQKAKLKKVE